MFAQVRLLNGFPQPLLYQVPDALSAANKGTIVQVPLKNRIVPAVITQTFDELPANINFKVRSIKNLEAFPSDPAWYPFICKAAEHYFLEPLYFFTRLRTFLAAKESETPITNDTVVQEFDDVAPVHTLTSAQQTIVDALQPAVMSGTYTPTLIHGVTGSGKTEVYKKLIIAALAAGKSAIFMAPEVSLCMRFEQLFANTLPPSITIIGFHSATTPKDKKALWQRLCDGKPTLIMGVHLPVLLPISNLGVIIIDEEHETGYREKKHPQLQSKELAIMRAHEHRIPIVLGSATPSIATLHLAHTKHWQIFSLTQRFGGAFPELSLVPLRTKDRRESFWITNPLLSALKTCLARGEQAIIFLNRRGYSFFMLCQECAHSFHCPHCSVTLTLHHTDETSMVSTQYLQCHYCGYQQPAPTNCPSCKAPERKLIQKGIGTQQVLSILQKLLPQARIARADMDTTKKKREWQQIVNDFAERKLDILVGTQTITKGYHFPGVTLVGVIWGDLNLNLPLYNAREKTIQQLIQVAGRAGRVNEQSRVIVQMMNDDPSFNYLDERTYPTFYEHEKAMRQLAYYPPFCRMVHIELRHKNELILERETQELARLITQKCQNLKQAAPQVLGPVKPAIWKVARVHMRHIFLKADSFKSIHYVLESINKSAFKSEILIAPQ